jgi:hypothetical protein
VLLYHYPSWLLPRWGFDNDHLGTLMPFGAPSTPSFCLPIKPNGHGQRYDAASHLRRRRRRRTGSMEEGDRFFIESTGAG